MKHGLVQARLVEFFQSHVGVIYSVSIDNIFITHVNFTLDMEIGIFGLFSSFYKLYTTIHLI